MTDYLSRDGRTGAATGAGDAERRVRGLGDQAAPLGAPDAWPPALQYALRFMFDAPAPAFLAWGGQLTLVYNDACAALLGRRDALVLGWPLAQALPQDEPLLPVLAGCARRALAGEAVRNEVAAAAPHGVGALLVTRVRIDCAPLRDLDGTILGVTGTLAAEPVPMDAEARVRAIADALPHMVWTTLPDGYHDYYNQRWYDFTGMREGETDGERWSGMFHPADRESAWARWRHALATGEPYEIEYRLRHHSGEYRWVLGRALPVRDAAGRIVRWMGTCTDIHRQKLAEEGLHDARLRLEAALVAGDLGTWTYDLGHDRVYADPNLAAIFGVPAERAAGAPLEDFLARIHPDDLAATRACIEDAVARRTRYECTYRVLGEEGGWRHVLARGKVTLDANGQPAWLPGVVLDITRQKAAEEALRKSEARFRLLAESNVVGMMRYRPDGAILAANQAFLDMLGYTREEFERDGLSSQKLTPPEWVDATVRVTELLVRSGRMDNFVKEYIRKDGSRASVQMGAVTIDPDSGEGLACVADISAIRDAQKALQESETRFRALADNIPQLAWMAEPDGARTWYNNRWIEFSGLPPDAALGWGWRQFHHPDHVERTSAGYIDHFRRGVVWEDIFPLRGRDGNYRWFLTRAVPIRGEDGAIVRWFGTNTDVTAQREAENALREADRRKDEFLAMLAHELRNPLAPIMAAADFLGIGQPDEARVRQVTAVIARQARHMTGLIDDLLDVSRVTRGLVTLQREQVALSGVIGEAVEQVRPLVEAKRHRLEVAAPDGPAAPAMVRGDRKRLVQIFANLLGNAAKYTPEGGHIELSTHLRFDAAGERVAVTVRDDGIGMSPELVARAFELFSQGERSADRSQGGLGIGLALVKSLAELHEGSVRAESAGPGQGSRFTVSLPLFHAEARAPAAGAEAARATPLKLLEVLIVDDNVDAAQLLALYIEALGHRPVVAHDPEAALAAARRQRFDLCVLDIGLPLCDGYELAHRLRALPGMARTPMAALSGYGQASDRARAREAGFARHFVKPVKAADVLELLHQVAQGGCTPVTFR